MAAGEEISSKFAFKLGKSSAPKKLQTSAIAEEVKSVDKDTNFVATFDGKEIKSSDDNQDAKKTLVIPMIEANRWRDREDRFAKKRKSEPTKAEGEVDGKDIKIGEKKEDIDSLAIKELVTDASRRNDDWEERGDPGYSDIAIPLLMQNKVPEGFETDEKLDVSLRPEAATGTDYDAVPVEAFGFAMLRGMGWKDGEGIGKDKKIIDQVEPGLRPKGLGLGADRSNAKKDDKSKKTEEEQELEMKKGTYCQVQTGHHKDMYGQIIATDTENSRVMVKLAIGGETVNLLQFLVRLVTKKEYDKSSKIINKAKVDKYKEREERERTHQSNGDREHSRNRSRDRDDKQSDRHRNRDSDKRDRDSRRDRDSDRGRDKDRDRNSGKTRDRDEERVREHEKERNTERDSERSDRKRKHDDSGKSRDKSSAASLSSSARLWIRPQCRVRIVDKKYHKGKYYKEKVVVYDVMGDKTCLCKTDDGKLLEGLSQSMLETVIPKSIPSFIVIVTGKYYGQLAEIINKDKLDCVATVQLLSDRDQALKLDFDSICEYVGDMDAEMDY
ncbi:G-patch domain and KOW motifs-containing protein-like [Lineus longissimus]|uniref:G-patch domain and KOW motifs-containing protein-like n=1 Tax=Lineus longissimus TaxID=88925 RepID=UPI002B4CC372